MGAENVFLGTVVPILGGFIAIAMYCSPLKAVYEARQQQSLGDLNPIPFAVTVVSTASWNAYGLAAPDYNMFLPNIPGLCAGLYNSITCYALASFKMQDLIMAIICGASCILMMLGAITRFICTGEQGKLMWGIVCNIITIAYYAAPLSSAYQVVSSKDSASVYLPTCVANLTNATLWVAYGFAVSDFFIWVPNGLGALFAILLIVLCFMYPKKGINAGTAKAFDRTDGSKRSLLDTRTVEEGIQLQSPDYTSTAQVCVEGTAQHGDQNMQRHR